jgi:multidrug efflux pump
VGLAVFQLPGSNALETADNVKRKMEELKLKFPEGLDYRIGYDTTPFIRESVNEVFKTLRDAVILVAIVVLVFLQDWKAMILPMIDVPVSLVGTFAVMVLLGFNLNNLTLFGLVLAIGIVVDDAIVVLENVERQIAGGLEPKAATIKAMNEVTGPILAITLVLCAVFLPSAFLPGVTGQFYRQFALTISASMVISAINAMTLTPSRAVTIFKGQGPGGHEHHREALPWWIFALVGGWLTLRYGGNALSEWLGVPTGEEALDVPAWKTYGMIALAFLPGAIAGGAIGWFIVGPVNRVLAKAFGAFNRGFDRMTNGYGRSVGRMARVSAIVLLIYAGLLALTAYQLSAAPKGFIPIQDQGYLLVNVQLPDSASVTRTRDVMTKITKLAHGDPADPERYPGIPGVAHTLSISGQSILLSANGSNFGSAFIVLDSFEHRHGHETYDATVAQKLRELCAAEVEEAVVSVFRAPPIQGLGSAGGFRFQIEQRGFVNMQELDASTQEVVREGNSDPRLTSLFSMYRANTPQLYINVDRTKCESLGVNMQQVFDTLQVYMGGYFVNLFNKFGRTWQVNLMAEPDFRAQASSIEQLKVRNIKGEMVPLGTLLEVRDVGGPVMVTRYNMYNSASVNGDAAPGVSSGQAIGIIHELADRLGVSYEWTEIMFLQIQAGNVGLFVFALATTLVYLILAAKYESWRLPMSIILVVPMCILCAVTGMLIARLPVDIFVQIGLLVLVGMAAKNAILIVEFANQLYLEGASLYDATVEASKLRLRPIVMTSFAFILGVVPLVIGVGAGAEMRNSLGTAVFAGMIGVTVFGIFLTPVFFYVIMRLTERKQPRPAPTPSGDSHAVETVEAPTAGVV